MRTATATYEALFTLGGRSFSIWSGRRHAGLRQRQPTSSASRPPPYPANFNASNDNNTFDDRSDNKGPEPEGITVGEIDGRTYAFIGLERIGGIMMYDVTDAACAGVRRLCEQPRLQHGAAERRKPAISDPKA